MHFLRELWDNAGVRRDRRRRGTVLRSRAGAAAAALLRPSLVVEQVHNTGALSLVIIMTCGLFVGMVLGLTGYDLLQRFGSEERSAPPGRWRSSRSSGRSSLRCCSRAAPAPRSLRRSA